MPPGDWDDKSTRRTYLYLKVASERHVASGLYDGRAGFGLLPSAQASARRICAETCVYPKLRGTFYCSSRTTYRLKTSRETLLWRKHQHRARSPCTRMSFPHQPPQHGMSKNGDTSCPHSYLPVEGSAEVPRAGSWGAASTVRLMSGKGAVGTLMYVLK